MGAGIAGWTPALERTFKESLYRFLEDLQATKAALYLLAEDGRYVLVTQYGFGRRDLLAAEHPPETPMVLLVRRLRSAPRAFNSPDEIPELADYLEGAGTARLLLAPLFAASRIFGFLDVRDKGRKRNFTQADIRAAATIAADMLSRLRETHLYAELDEAATLETPGPEPLDQGPLPALAAQASLDSEALAMILHHAASLASCLGVHAITVTLWERQRCQSIVLAPGELHDEDLAALKRHQGAELQRHGRPVPRDEEWEVILRPVESAPQGGGRTIATSGLSAGTGIPLVLSVIAGKPAEARRHLGALLLLAEEQVRATELRFSRRRTVRNLLATSPDEANPLVVHGEQVSRLAWAVTRVLGLPAKQAEEVALAGLVHDLGLPEVLGDAPYHEPDPGPEKRHLYRRHVKTGERRLLDLGLQGLASIVRHHHERWDGTGYPDRLAGDAIPLAARIVHAAEVYDVLTSSSSYRRTVSTQRALAIVKAAAGSQFDPRVVTALEEALQ